jgi:hypothetical protein
MLAYVFWHWKRPEAGREDYQAAQRQFHEALAQAPPTGLVCSWSASIGAAPWTPVDREAYEDWYLLEGSAALDTLNDGAVTASRQQPHDAAARLAEGGTAGLFRLRSGHVQNSPTTATWFSKPAGVAYPAFIAELERALVGVSYGLWMRQMTLGPSPEFCVRTSAPIVLPCETACSLSLRHIWP